MRSLREQVATIRDRIGIDDPRPKAITDFRWQGPCPGEDWRGYRAGETMVECLPEEDAGQAAAIASAIVEDAWRPSFDAVDLPRIQFHRPHILTQT